MRNHKTDGISYAKPKGYKCKVCKQRLTSDEYKDSECPGKPVEQDDE